MMAPEDKKVEMEILCKWNVNFHSDWLERKKWSTSKGRLFVPENFRLIRAYHLHFYRLDRKAWINVKLPCPLIFVKLLLTTPLSMISVSESPLGYTTPGQSIK